jgi:hypothetical protein
MRKESHTDKEAGQEVMKSGFTGVKGKRNSLGTFWHCPQLSEH